jgi:hypothetical protein
MNSVGMKYLNQTLWLRRLGLLNLNLKWLYLRKYITEKEMITDKDAKEFHKMIKKLEEQNRFKKEQDELKESYEQSKKNKKERDDKK